MKTTALKDNGTPFEMFGEMILMLIFPLGVYMFGKNYGYDAAGPKLLGSFIISIMVVALTYAFPLLHICGKRCAIRLCLFGVVTAFLGVFASTSRADLQSMQNLPIPLEK